MPSSSRMPLAEELSEHRMTKCPLKRTKHIECHLIVTMMEKEIFCKKEARNFIMFFIEW